VGLPRMGHLYKGCLRAIDMFRKSGAPEGRSIGRLCISILSLARYPEAAVETLEGPALEPLERKGLGARYHPSG
jgi:hypothetical protein